jgi:hypothetical protein
MKLRDWLWFIVTIFGMMFAVMTYIQKTYADKDSVEERYTIVIRWLEKIDGNLMRHIEKRPCNGN